MKTLKLVLWIFILYIIQNVFCPIISITNIVPELLLSFAVSYAAVEHRFNRLSAVVIVCAVVSGTGTGRVFPIVTTLVGVGGMASYLFRGYLRFIPQFLRTQAVTAIFAFFICVAERFVFSHNFTSSFFVDIALWYTVYTVAVSSVIYLILSKTILKDTNKKILIAQERN